MARWMQQTTLPTLAMLTWEQVGSGRCWWLNDQDTSLTLFDNKDDDDDDDDNYSYYYCSFTPK